MAACNSTAGPLELLAGRSLCGSFQHKWRVQAACCPVQSSCRQEFVREKTADGDLGSRVTFSFFTLSPAALSSAVALCLLYLQVLHASLNREPLWQHLSAVCSQRRLVQLSPLVSAEDPLFLRCFFPDRSGAAKLPYCWNTQCSRIGCSAPSKAPPSRRCILDARKSLDFLVFHP